MKTQSLILGSLLGLSLVGCAGGGTKTPTLRFIALAGGTPTEITRAYDVSNNGVVVGQRGTAPNTRGTFWDAAATGPFDAGATGRVLTGSEMAAVSANGKVSIWRDEDDFYYLPLDDDPIRIGSVSNGYHSVNGISPDGGTVFVTRYQTNGSGAVTVLNIYSWTPTRGLTYLYDWPAAPVGQEGLGRIRTAAVGFGKQSGRSRHYSPANGYRDFVGLTGSPPATVHNMSTNGRFFAGTSGGKALIWEDDPDNARDLGALSGATSSIAYGVSDDGRVAVGESGGKAFLWREGSGMVELKSYLIGQGQAIRNWTVQKAVAVSPNGAYLIGQGISPSGREQAFLVKLN